MPESALAAAPVPKAAAAPLLAVRDLNAWYGESHVLHGISFDVFPGEVVTLLGRNGAGKTTTMKSIMGVLGKRQGSIVFDGVETIGLPARTIARHGIGYVPEERGICSSLSRREPRVAARRQAGRHDPGADLRAVPEPARAPDEPGHQAVRRRAADAGDRARAPARG